jgi:serine/threonine protein kinase
MTTMDYSAYYYNSYNTEVDHHDNAATLDGPNRNATEDPDSGFDLLSFFATALQDSDNAEEKWTPLVLFSIHLGPWNMFQSWTVYSGSSFSVTLIPSKFLLRKTAVKPDFLLPRQLAVKTPRLKPDPHSSHNSKLLLSLAKEYQILKTELLASHENIVNAYGCCWQTLPTGPSQPMPSLILEGSPFGDVSTFSRSRFLTLRERLRLCLDVTSGLDALHTHGVIHGDLKLNNILVFKSRSQGYIAKLADFGSAILLSETTFPCRAPPGTKVYRAPECTDGSVVLRRDDLVKTDLFSLGVTLAFLLVGSHIVDDIMTLSESDIQSLKEDNQLADWIVAHRHDRSEHAAARRGRGEWVTDPSWGEVSLFADFDLTRWFTILCDHLLAAEAHRRPESVETPAIVLRHMIRQHLQTLPPRATATRKTSGLATDPASSARMAALMSMSKARYRKLTGGSVLSESRIKKEEVMAIAYCCNQPGSYLKEAKFIVEWNEGKALKVKKRASMAQHTKRGLSRKRPLIPARVVGLANKMALFVKASCVIPPFVYITGNPNFEQD